MNRGPVAGVYHHFTSNSAFAECDGKLDIAFLLDSSGSIRHEKYPEVLQFVADIAEQLEVREGRTNIGVIVYSDMAFLDIKLSDYLNKEDLIWAIKLLPYRPGRTSTAAAIELLTNQFFTSANGERFDAPNIVVLITDGHDTVNAQDTLPQAIAARENGIHFMVVTLESMQVELEVKGIASDPDDLNVFTAPRFSSLPGLVESIVQATCVGKVSDIPAFVNSFWKGRCACNVSTKAHGAFSRGNFLAYWLLY